MKKFLSMCGIALMCCFLTHDGVCAGKQTCITAACPKGTNLGENTEYIQSYVGGNQCYSCDSNDYAFTGDTECPYGAIVLQKEKYGRGIALYQCVDTNGAKDEWHNYNPGALCDGAKELSGPHVEKYYLNKGQATQAQISGDNTVRLAGHDACYYYDCDEPNNYEIKGNECVPKQPEKKEEQTTPQPTNCKSTRTTKIGLACCDEKRSSYVANADQCICWDKDKKFDIINGRGQCVDGGDTPDVTVVPIDCNTTTGAHLNEKTNQCECASSELRLNEDGVSCSCTDSNKVYKNGKCEYSEEYLLLIKLKEIREVRARLDGIMNGFKVSVWKDAEGNFNTARLASDSVAGVVLGTVGGVVTSVVVKKNQLKKGFEAIQCAIGGQTVADYNDEFVVGPAR